MNNYEEAIRKHLEWQGKIETSVRCDMKDMADLAVAYTPGVAGPCLEIQKDPDKSFDLTRRWNTVAVVTDGTAVLGLGDIGPEAGMPVMEGKCALFKKFGGVDAIPLCIRSKDVDKIVETVKLLAGSFGGVNLEDIAAPRCFEVERRLKEETDIIIFHDDQHGTAIVVAAALLNAVKVLNKKMGEMKIVINGAGAAGTAIGKLLLEMNFGNVVMCDINGIICEGDESLSPAHQQLAAITNRNHETGTLKDALVGADCFIGVSRGNLVTCEMVATMNEPIVFALANPVPEITPEEAAKGGARIIGTGRSDYPNQINNVLVFPGLFRGALDARSRDISEEMKMAAAQALAAVVTEDELSADYILPSIFDERVSKAVAQEVRKTAIETGLARKI